MFLNPFTRGELRQPAGSARHCRDALAAAICGLILGTIAGATHDLRSAVSNAIYSDAALLAIRRFLPAAALSRWRLPGLSRAANLPIWLAGAFAHRMNTFGYNTGCMTNWKKYVIALRLDGIS